MQSGIVREKLDQVPGILREKNIDMWLTFVRESDTIRDPALELILGTGLTWQSAVILTAGGDREIILGSLDADNIKSLGLYGKITPYVNSIRETLAQAVKGYAPKKIAINKSRDDVMSDGLTAGMYENLLECLQTAGCEDRLVSAQSVIAALRGRKSAEEIGRIQKAVEITEEIYDRVTAYAKPGMSEKDIAAFILNITGEMGLETAWDQAHCPGVFVGPQAAGAHAGPTDRKIEKGFVMHLDFGVKYQGYCSDLQRTWYFLNDGETAAPEPVQKAFDALKASIAQSFEAVKPGVEGIVPDTVSRRVLKEHGFDEYPHALGHQVGRSTHDGAGLLCPSWERYGSLPHMKIEKGQVYTLEPRISLPEYGVVTMEEMIEVAEEGAHYLSRPQTELILISSK